MQLYVYLVHVTKCYLMICCNVTLAVVSIELVARYADGYGCVTNLTPGHA